MISDAAVPVMVFAVAAAVSSMGVAVRLFMPISKKAKANAYRNRIIDAIYNLSGEELDGRCRWRLDKKSLLVYLVTDSRWLEGRSPGESGGTGNRGRSELCSAQAEG